MNPKVNRRKKIVKTRGELNETGNKKTMKKIRYQRACSLENK